VFWVPRRSIAVERALEDEGVYGDITQVCACARVSVGGVSGWLCGWWWRRTSVCVCVCVQRACVQLRFRGVHAAHCLRAWCSNATHAQGEFPLDLVPLEDDVLSLELDAAFR
jgi:hypothetical protein